MKPDTSFPNVIHRTTRTHTKDKKRSLLRLMQSLLSRALEVYKLQEPQDAVRHSLGFPTLIGKPQHAEQ